MRILVVYSHPCEESFNAAICKTVLESLDTGKHEVRLTDLYAIGFDPVMSAEERRKYHTPDLNREPIADQLEDIKWAEALIFVYPTWWFGLPAMLKGWLERVWVPHETFEMPTETHGLRSKMDHITRIGVITTCGAPWWLHKFVGEPGRRTLLRGLKHVCSSGCKTLYLAHYKMDTSSQESREKFLKKVAARVASFMS